MLPRRIFLEGMAGSQLALIYTSVMQVRLPKCLHPTSELDCMSRDKGDAILANGNYVSSLYP